MPTITIEVPEDVTRKDIKIDLRSLDDRSALFLLSLVLERALLPTEDEIAEIAEQVEEAVWKKLKEKLKP